MAFKAKRRFLKNIWECKRKKNNFKKELPCFFTPSALEKWNYEYRVETEKRKQRLSEQKNDT